MQLLRTADVPRPAAHPATSSGVKEAADSLAVEEKTPQTWRQGLPHNGASRQPPRDLLLASQRCL